MGLYLVWSKKLKKLADQPRVEVEIKITKLRRKKKHFDLVGRDEYLNDPQERFNLNFSYRKSILLWKNSLDKLQNLNFSASSKSVQSKKIFDQMQADRRANTKWEW